jgi:hypothetical protein
MISKAYEKPDFCIVKFELEDVLTASAVVHTTQPSTTIPTTTIPTTTLPSATEGGLEVGGNGQGDIVFNPSEYFSKVQ